MTILSVVEAVALNLIGPILIRQRSIGGFIANVTIREDHEDELVVTENPVEQGARITDHSFKAPAKLTVDVGYSNSSVQSLGNFNYVNDVYAQFLQLQALRQPFDVFTGKRAYNNMLITLLHTITDKDTENSMLLTVRMKQIILVNTQTVSVPPANKMSTPSATGAPQNLGTGQTQFSGGSTSTGVGGSSATTPVAPSSTAFNYADAPYSAGFGFGG